MLQKVQAANMASMTQANSLIACVGRMNLSAKRLKELGSNAKLKAKELHDVEVAEQNKMDHGTVSNCTKEMDTNPEISITELEVPVEHQMEHEPQEENMSQDQDPDGFWRTTILEGTQILMMANNGNCFFRSISDQMNHNQGARHEFIWYQITNHIRRNGDEFKDILLMQDDDEEITDLVSYLHKMGQNSEWGGGARGVRSIIFYKVDITIYSKEYAGTGGSLIFKADGPKGNSKRPCPMWHISYHDNKHYNSV
jgi:hypothetical protein